MAALRPMTADDLPAVLALQAQGYPPALHDAAPAFLSRMAMAPAMNLVAWDHAGLSGYLVSHAWISGSPPPVDTVLSPPHSPQCWYVHDLSVGPQARGTGLAQALIAAGAAAARAAGLGVSELVAVEGAAPFWEKQGWRARTLQDPALAAKVAAYGASAVFMTKAPI